MILPPSDLHLHQAERSWTTGAVSFISGLTALTLLPDREQVLAEDPLTSRRNKGGPQMGFKCVLEIANHLLPWGEAPSLTLAHSLSHIQQEFMSQAQFQYWEDSNEQSRVCL